ncbi:hypothetical protein pb186bvf_015251, partial [Paramecium bursaria]
MSHQQIELGEQEQLVQQQDSAVKPTQVLPIQILDIEDSRTPHPEEMASLITKIPERDDEDPIVKTLNKKSVKMTDWYNKFKSGGMQVSNEQANYEQSIDMIYRGLICLRRVTRIFLHIITLGAVIAFFLWGYYVSVGDSTWEAQSSHQIIFVNQSNCVLNVVDRNQSFVSFSYFIEGGLLKQINSSTQFKVSGIESKDSLNLTFRSTNQSLTSCLIDLYIPYSLTNFTLYCEVKGFCVTVFNTTKFQTSNLNIIADDKAQIQVSIQNATTTNFYYYTASAGALYLNNIFFNKGYIEQASGTILVQSLGDINATFTSFQKSYCAASINTVASVSNCGLNDTKLCAGTLSACASASCNYQSNIQIRGNSSNIYINQVKAYGKSWINGEDSFSMVQSALYNYYADTSTPLFTNIDQSTKKEINQILNTTLSGSSFTFRIDVGGHYLLRQQDNSYWAYFSNRRFSEFQPWWISTLSGSLIQSKFAYIQATLLPGFCPYQPTMNLTQLYSIQQVLQNTMNQDFDQVAYIQKDNRQLPSKKPDNNFTYTGVDDLPEKKKNQYEQWFIFEIANDSYIYEKLPQNPFLTASIILSGISALIFAATATYFLRTGIYALEGYMLQSVATFQNYSSTNIPDKDDVKQAIAKKMLAKLDQLESEKSPPLLYGILSYGIYIYAQESKASAQSFCNTFFRKTNFDETEQFYNGSLDQEMIAIDESDLKELYETFCYLNRLTIEQLSQDEKLLESYGYELVEKDSTSSFLSKLKMKTDRKPYHLLNEKERTSVNSLELFFSTQVQLTGIEADIIAADKLEKHYKEFCGRVLNVEGFNVRDIANDYSLGISDKKNFELRLKPSLRQKQKGWLSRFLGRCVNYVPLLENYYEKDPVYVIRRNNQVLNFQQNPLKSLGSRKWSWLYYNFVTMWYSSLKFNYKRRIFNREFTYGEKDDHNIIMDFLDAIYMKGWVWTEVMVVLGNLLFTAIAVLPIAFLLMLINTQYSVYSIYDPRNLIFIEDILQRPWTVFNSSYVVDQWVLAAAILLLTYVVSAFVFQLFYFILASFPEEIGLLLDYQVYNKKGFIYYINWLQWIMFLVLYFFVFTYFGVILVWLLLGAIISPQDYLTYSTSALTFMTTIYSQFQSILYIYEQSTLQIKKITSELYLKTFGTVAFSLIKEVQRLSDNSLSLINSTAMHKAREMADQLGFGEELDELNILTQSMTENVSSGANLEMDQLKFKEIKDKFIEKSCNKFVTIATNQFKVPELIAQLLIVDTLANQIQIESQNTVPAGLIK